MKVQFKLETVGLLKKIFVVFIPVLLAVALGHILKAENDFFIISDTSVSVVYEDNQKAMVQTLKPYWVKELLGLKGQNIWNVSLPKLRNRILKNHWIKEVELWRRFPDRISTTIHLKGIIALFIDNKNEIFVITREGEKLGPVEPTLVPVVPVLYNDRIAEDPEFLKKLTRILGEIPDFGALKTENISSINFKPMTGLQLNLMDSGITVYLGEENISTKGLQVLRVMDYLKSQNQKARVIDASFTKKVLVRLRKGS